MSETNQPEPSDREALERLQEATAQLRGEIGKIVIGQEAVVEQLLIAILARGHCILEGVPGLAKTLLVSTLARCLDLGFNRVQFTPDLMPTDITGTEVIQEDKSTGTRARSQTTGRECPERAHALAVAFGARLHNAQRRCVECAAQGEPHEMPKRIAPALLHRSPGLQQRRAAR